MPKKPNHTKCRKKTFKAMKRKRVLGSLLKRGKIKMSEYIKQRAMPLRLWKA